MYSCMDLLCEHVLHVLYGYMGIVCICCVYMLCVYVVCICYVDMLCGYMLCLCTKTKMSAVQSIVTNAY